MRKVGTAASFMYRERFLIDKYSLDAGEPTPDFADVIDVEVLEDIRAIDEPDDGANVGMAGPPSRMKNRLNNL